MISALPHNAVFLADEVKTTRFGAWLASYLYAGDCVLLDGAIGAGKSHLARAVIQAKLGRLEDVPSPTFTLVQTYQAKNFEIWHADLYRLSHADELIELGLDAAFPVALCLIEWPKRLGHITPTNPILITLSNSHDGRTATITAPHRPDLMLALDQDWARHDQ